MIDSNNQGYHPPAARKISYAGPETGMSFVVLWETEDGNRYTPEQWFILQQMDRLEKKIEALTKALEQSR